MGTRFDIHIQLTPALTNFKGPTFVILYRRIFVIANIENKEIRDLRLASVIDGFLLLAGPL